MGSRRARRSNGRTTAGLTLSRKPRQGISKAQRLANRALHKANILSAARALRESARAKAPPLLAFFSMCNNANSDQRLKNLARTLEQHAVSTDNKISMFTSTCIQRGHRTNREIIISALDVAKVADMIVLVFDGRDEMDDVAISVIDALRAQGLPSVHVIAIGDGRTDQDLRKLRSRQLAAESLGEEHALRSVHVHLDDDISLNVDDDDDDDDDETKKLAQQKVNVTALRRLFAKQPHQVAWRARYGYMLVEKAILNINDENDNYVTLKGWIRGRGMSANELVHITGFGTFVAREIIDVETCAVLSTRDDANAEPIESLAPVDETMGEQTWPPEVDDMGDNDEDLNDEQDDVHTSKQCEDEGQLLAKQYDEEIVADDDGEENMSDQQLDEEIDNGKGMDTTGEEYMSIDVDEVKRARNAARTDLEFPDEVDTPLDKPARTRFARYRGLKSLRTGEWDPKEQLPRDYASLFQFRNLAATRKRVIAAAMKESEEAAKTDKGVISDFVDAGKEVYVRLENVSIEMRRRIKTALDDDMTPIVACGLLRHENRRSVVHFAVKRIDNNNEDVIKAKSHLEMHCGFVRFQGRPMFSEHNANSDKHKMERYLAHNKIVVASFYGPAIFTPAPAILCQHNGMPIAYGNTLGADPDRIILKRIILTGYPFKTQKKRTVAKFMFFNPEDVRWFKPVELWTKLGRTGHILEPIGTHGHMKCQFDGVVMHHDTICMTLYKRVYPKLVEQDEI